MNNTIRLQKTRDGNCVYMHKGKMLYINKVDIETPTGFNPLIIEGEIKKIGTNADFNKKNDNTVQVTITNDNDNESFQLYTKQKGGPIENMELLRCNNTGEIILPTRWSFKCHKNKYCIPTKGEGTSYKECKEKCGVTEDDNVNYILSIISIVLIAVVLLLFIFVVMFSNDINNSTSSFFKHLMVILFIT